MKRWNFLLVATVVVCYYGTSCSATHEGSHVPPAVGNTLGIGVRAVPDHDSEAMIEFKNSLNDDEKALLKRHLSKTRFIQPLMDSSRAMLNRRKLTEAVKKRSEISTSDCCNCSPDSVGCFHPADVKRSNIIRCCQSPPAAETVAVGARQVQSDSTANQKALSALSPEDQELLKKHMSKINNLIAAEAQPDGSGNTFKREEIDTVAVDARQADSAVNQALSALSPEDQELLKKHMSKINNLIAAEAQPDGSGNTFKREEIDTDAKREVAAVDAAGQKALSSLSQEDQELYQKYLSKINNLVVAEEEPDHSGSTAKREKADGAESVSKKDTIQKLYDQLEGLKQVVGDLKTQNQIEKKNLEESNKRDLDEMSQRIWSDVTLAKKKGINANDLLDAIRKRAALKQAKAGQTP